MSSDKQNSRGVDGFAQFIGKWVYQTIQRYFPLGEPMQAASEPSTVAQVTASVEAEGIAVAAGISTVVVPDGAKLAYEILGSQHLGKTTPVVMICGMTALRGDDERVNKSLAKSHPGAFFFLVWSRIPEILTCSIVLMYDHRCAPL